MDVFANPNIGAWVVEQVPCSFAKTGKNSKIGTHYVMVLLDRDSNILFVGSECERKHGEGIQAIYEMGGRDTCFTASMAFRHVLSLIKAGGNLPNRYPLDVKLTSTLVAVLETVWKSASTKHNDRVFEKSLHKDNLKLNKVVALQSVADRVACNLMGLHPHLYHGRFSDRVHNASLFAKTDLIYPRVFRLNCRRFNEHDIASLRENSYIRLPVQSGLFTTMEFVDQGRSTERVFAVRDFDESGKVAPGKWAFSNEAVKEWASGNYTTLDAKKQDLFKLNAQKKDHMLCIFCGEEYDRMYRHKRGAKHITRVSEIAGLVCKATSSLGLKMLNNPRHRTAFIREG